MRKNYKLAIATTALCVVTTLRAWHKKRRQLRRPKQWCVRPGLKKRSSCGFYATMRSKMVVQDPKQSISVGERSAVTLRYLATGDSYASLMSVFLIGKTTICGIIRATCCAINDALKDAFLKVPSTCDEWETIADRFAQRWIFPYCCGALDGKHIAIQVPANCGSEYFNYIKFNSVVLMALVDADYRFLFVEVGAYGRESDGGVFARCPLSAAPANNTIHFPDVKSLPHEGITMPFVIITDDGFPLKPYLLKPFSYRELT